MDREDHSSSGGSCPDDDPVDRDLPEQYLQRGHGDSVLPLRPDRDGQPALRAGLRARVPEDDDYRVCDLPDPAYRELAGREDRPAPLSDRRFHPVMTCKTEYRLHI